MYLMFGVDYPSNIAEYFQRLKNKDIENHKRSSVLRYPNRIGVLLNKMNEEELLIVHREKEKGKRGPPMKKYELNPKLIQSFFRSENSNESYCLIFDIPLEKVKESLASIERINKDNIERNKFFSRRFSLEFTYFSFNLYFRSYIFNLNIKK
jgi:hypothetical protein